MSEEHPSPSSAALLRIEALRFRWPRQQEDCLCIPRFALASGEAVFLHGESGSGKSSLLGLVGGVLSAHAGSIRLLEHELATMAPPRRDRLRADHIGFIFQQFNLVPYLSVLDNVLLPCRFSARRAARATERGEMRTEARRLLQHLDLAPELWTRRATELSVGQQQRVAAARALLGRPELLIADEPTSALDAARQDAFLELLLAECRAAGSALLFVSHDQRLAGHFSRSVSMTEIQKA